MNKYDKAYIEFVESMDMDIPDNDCTDYRDQDDYRGICFMQDKIQELESQLAQVKAQLNEAVEVVRFYDSNTVAKYEFCRGDFADHEVTGFQVSNKRARAFLTKLSEANAQ